MSPPDPVTASTARAAYEGVEASFSSREEVERYRSAVLGRSVPQADLIAPLLVRGSTAVEVACGNGRLLIELARRGAIGSGLGLDIARSRIEFARQWAADAGMEGLGFEAADALEADLGTGHGLAICATGALGYFGAASPRRDASLVARMRSALAPGGLLVLELYPHPGERRLLESTGGEVRTWRELEPGDPWRFYLSHLVLRGDVLTHAKTFIHRESGEVDEGRSESLYLYRPEDVPLDGFEDVRFREGWSDDPYAGGDVLVVTARRA